MQSTNATAHADGRLAEVLDQLALALDAIACRAADLDPDQRARLVETLSPVADELHAAGLDDQPIVDDQAAPVPRLWRPC